MDIIDESTLQGNRMRFTRSFLQFRFFSFFTILTSETRVKEYNKKTNLYHCKFELKNYRNFIENMWSVPPRTFTYNYKNIQKIIETESCY